MSEALTIAGTVLSGLVVLVAGRLIEKFVLEPAKEFKQLVGRIEHTLALYDCIYSNPQTEVTESYREASTDLRKMASLLRGKANELPSKKAIRGILHLPALTDIREASSCLIGLSNGVYSHSDDATLPLIDANSNKAQRVRELLRIK